MSLPFIGGTFGTPENWMWFLAGVIAWAVVQNLVLPDPWAVWLAQRRNLPVVLQLLAILGVAVSLGWNILVLTVGGAFIQALSRVRIELWVWEVLVGSILLLIVAVILSRLGRRGGVQETAEELQP